MSVLVCSIMMFYFLFSPCGQYAGVTMDNTSICCNFERARLVVMDLLAISSPTSTCKRLLFYFVAAYARDLFSLRDVGAPSPPFETTAIVAMC